MMCKLEELGCNQFEISREFLEDYDEDFFRYEVIENYDTNSWLIKFKFEGEKPIIYPITGNTRSP